ncbi:hypothetical protein ACLBO7_31115, partial [Klebsiella pneumoniae]
DLHEVEVDVRAPSKILAHLNILKGLVIKLQDFNNIDYKIAENLEKALADWNPDEAGMAKETGRDALLMC